MLCLKITDNKNIVNQLKSGNKTEEVEDFLKRIGVIKKV